MSKGYRCGCGIEVNSKKVLIDHYKECHPDDAYQLFDQIGTIGDKFADLALDMFKNKVLILEQQLKTSNTVESLLSKLVEQSNKESISIVAITNKGNSSNVILTYSVPTNIGLASMLLDKANQYSVPTPTHTKE